MGGLFRTIRTLIHLESWRSAIRGLGKEAHDNQSQASRSNRTSQLEVDDEVASIELQIAEILYGPWR